MNRIRIADPDIVTKCAALKAAMKKFSLIVYAIVLPAVLPGFLFAQNTVPQFPADTVQSTLVEDAAWDTTLTVSDADITGGDSIAFSLQNNPGMSAGNYLPSSVDLSWTPTNEKVGSHWMTVIATDSANASDTLAMEITVQNINDTPVLDPISEATILHTQSFIMTATASDPDTLYGDTLTFSISGEPSGMTIGSTSGKISYDPPDAIGDSSHTITVTVTDDSGATDSQSFTLNVNNPPEPITDLSVTVSNGVLDVSFTGSTADDIDSYRLYLGETTTTWDSTSLGETTYQDSTPPFGTQQYYGVAAIDNQGFLTQSEDTVTVDLSVVSGTWNHDQAIVGNISVQSGDQLTINGAQITFANNTGLTVNGILKVNASGTDTVTFTTGGLGWKGIRFQDANTDTSVVRYTRIVNGRLTASDMNGWGSGIYANNSLLKIERSYFSQNESGSGAGGGVAIVNSYALIQNCILYNNIADYGAAVYSENSTLDFINNTLVDNPGGAGLMISGGTPNVRNNIITGHQNGYGIETSVTSSFTHNLFYNNNGEATASSSQMSHRPTGFGGADSTHEFSGVNIDQYGNIFANPNFLSASDFHLRDTSAAINTGDPDDFTLANKEPEPNGDVVNLGAYGGTGEATKAKIRLPYDFSSTATEDSFYSESIDIPRDDDIAYIFEPIPNKFPSWLTLDDTPGNERLTGTPTNVQSETDSTVSIEVRESGINPVRDTLTFTLSVLNSPPTISGLAETISVEEDSQLVLTPSASDPGVSWEAWLDNETVPNIPDSIDFDDATGEFEWTPGNPEVGSHTLRIRAEESKTNDNAASDTITIEVANTNDPPHFRTGQSLENANIWLPYRDTLVAGDPDTAYGDVLSYSLLDGPANLTVDDQAGAIAWQSFYADSGDHDIQVRVTDSAGLSDTLLATLTVIDTVGPEPPETLEASWADTTVMLSWNTSTSGDLKSFNVYRRSEDQNNSAKIADLGGDTLEFTDTPLENEMTYYYSVASVDSAGIEGTPSDTLTVVPRDTVAPMPPSNFTVSDSNGVAFFSWEASPTSDVTDYRIMRSFDQSEYTGFDSVDASTLSHSKSLDSLTTMWFTVQAKDESGNHSENSNIERIDPFGPPTNLQATNKAWRIQLTWDAVTNDNVSTLRIYRGVNDSNNLTLYDEIAAARTGYVDQVNAEDTYYYAISARNGDGTSESALSDPATGQAKTKGAVAGIWTVENGPYKPTGSLIVDEGDTLTIHGSTNVLFQGYYDFIVYGLLRIQGTEDSLVTVTYDSTISNPPGYENWKGMTFSGADDNSRINYAKLRHARITGTLKGGAIRISDSDPVISNTRITANQSYSHGGAIAVSGNSAPVITGNIISENTSTNGYGGGIVVLGGAPVIRNNKIAGNTAKDAGAVYVSQNQSMEFYNNNVIGNGFTPGSTQPMNIGGVWDADGASDIHSSIFSDNSGYPLGVTSLSGDFQMTYNLLHNNDNNTAKNGPVDFLMNSIENANFDSTDAYGNMDFSPGFVGTTDSLDRNSVALDAGKPTATYTNEPEPNGDQVNIGRFGNTTTATTSPIRLRESIPDGQQPVEDSTFEYLVSGRHDTGATVTYEAVFSAGAEWLSFSQVDNTLSGDPTNDHVGPTYTVTIYAEDENFDRADNAEYDILVTGRAPQITGPTDTSVVQGELLKLGYSSDDDPDATYTVRYDGMMDNQPTFSDDTLRWTPNNNQTGEWVFEIWAKDNHDDSTSIDLTVNVSNINDAPEFVNGDSLITNIIEKDLWTYRLDTVTVDPDTIYGDSIAYSLRNAPPGLVFSDSTTLLEWMPTNSEIGTYNFEAIATDLEGAADTLHLKITTINVNDAPEFLGALDTTIREDVPIRFPLSVWQNRVVDPDPTDSLESLQWTFTSLRGLAQVSRITIGGDSVAVAPIVADSSGVDSISVVVADNEVSIDTTMIVTVQSVNDTPAVIQPLPDKTIPEDTPSLILLPKVQNYFTDADAGDSLRFNAQALDNGMDSLRFSSNDGAGSGQASTDGREIRQIKRSLSIPRTRQNLSVAANDSPALIAFPTPNFDGEIRVTVTATDDSGAWRTDTMLVTVTGVNDTPVVAIQDTTVAEDDTLVIPLNTVITEYEDTFGEMPEIRLTQDPQNSQVASRKQKFRSGSRREVRDGNPGMQTFSRTQIPAEQVHHIFTTGNDTLLMWGDPNYYHRQAGQWELYARDSQGAADSANFQFRITAVPDPPVFANPVGTQTIQEDGLLELMTDALEDSVVDPDTLYGEQPAYSWEIIVSDTGNLSVTQISGGFELHPEADWSGSENFIVQVIDTIFTVQDTGTLQVTPVNDAPTIDFPAVFSIREDDSVTIDLDDFSADADHDTSELDWTLPNYIDNGLAGTSVARLNNVTHKNEKTSEAAGLSVRKSNSIKQRGVAPEIRQIEGDILSFALDSQTHELMVIPDPDSTVTNAQYLIRVSDPLGAVTQDTIRFTVSAINDPPRFVTDYPDTSFSEHDTLLYTDDYLLNTVEDVDTPDDNLQFRFEVGANLVLTTTDSTYAIRGEQYWFGQDTISLVVSDGVAQDSLTFLATLYNGNDAPVWTENFPDTTIFRPSQTREFILRDSTLVFDPDPHTPISSLQFEVQSGSLVRINYNSGSTRARLFILDDTTAVDTVYFTAIDPEGMRGVHMMTVILDPTYVGIDDENLIPREFVVEQNYPNPFNPTTTIEYGLPQAADVALHIFNLRGQEIYSEQFKQQTAGYYQFQWDGKNAVGQQVSSGMYIYMILARAGEQEFRTIRKMVLIR